MALFRRWARFGTSGPLLHARVALIAATFGLAVYGVIKLLVYLSQDLLGNPL